MSDLTKNCTHNLFNQFLAELYGAGISENTVRAYQHDLNFFAYWYTNTIGEEISENKITSLDIREYQQFLINRKFKASTINRRLVPIRRYLQWAQERGMIKQVPKMPKGIKKEKLAPRALKRNEQNALLRAVEQGGNKRDIAIIYVLVYCGLRVSELVGLKLDNLVIKDRTGKIIVLGKGNKVREVPVPAEVRAALREYLVVRKDSKPEVFLGQRGPLTVQGVQRLVEKYAYHAKLENVTPHVLRHTCATYYLDKGVDIVKVAAILGHENLNTTMVYTRPSFEDLARVVE